MSARRGCSFHRPGTADVRQADQVVPTRRVRPRWHVRPRRQSPLWAAAIRHTWLIPLRFLGAPSAAAQNRRDHIVAVNPLPNVNSSVFRCAPSVADSTPTDGAPIRGVTIGLFRIAPELRILLVRRRVAQPLALQIRGRSERVIGIATASCAGRKNHSWRIAETWPPHAALR